MKYTNDEIKRALALAVDCLDAAYANEKDAHDRSETKLDALSKALDVLVTLGIESETEKSRAGLIKALEKYKKGALVHYFPLSGGQYVMATPNGVQTKDSKAVNVQIRLIGKFDAENPNQVSVGIALDNGHEATWSGKEFKIDDLECPLLLGRFESETIAPTFGDKNDPII